MLAVLTCEKPGGRDRLLPVVDGDRVPVAALAAVPVAFCEVCLLRLRRPGSRWGRQPGLSSIDAFEAAEESVKRLVEGGFDGRGERCGWGGSVGGD
jgi:hypothetical protein